MNRLLDFIIAQIRRNDLVDEENYDVVRFGLELLVMKSIISIFIVIIGVLSKSILTVAVFMAAFQPLRSFCGGYHAKLRSVCIISSLMMLVSVIFLSKAASNLPLFIPALILFIISSFVIAVFSPVDTSTKPFDDEEKRVYRKRSLIVLSVIWVFMILIVSFRIELFIVPVSMAVFYSAFLVTAGKFVNA